MAKGTRIGSAVMFVQQLDRSVNFYREVLALNVVDRSPTAALLLSSDGYQLILRAMGANAPHPLGGVGVQYVIWTAADEQDLAVGAFLAQPARAVGGSEAAADQQVVDLAGGHLGNLTGLAAGVAIACSM